MLMRPLSVSTGEPIESPPKVARGRRRSNMNEQTMEKPVEMFLSGFFVVTC